MVHGTRPQAVDDGCPATPHPKTASRRSLLARLGLVAGGAAAAVLHGAERAPAQTIGETMDIAPPAGEAALKLRPSGSVPPSTSGGGALNLDNSSSKGAGAGSFIRTRARTPSGRLLVVNQDNPANPQNAVRIQMAAAPPTRSRSFTTRPAARATRARRRWTSSRPIRSTRRSACAAGRRGRGTVKITHEKPVRLGCERVGPLDRAHRRRHRRDKANFIGNDAGNPTTGPLLNVRNGGPGRKAPPC